MGRHAPFRARQGYGQGVSTDRSEPAAPGAAPDVDDHEHEHGHAEHAHDDHAHDDHGHDDHGHDDHGHDHEGHDHGEHGHAHDHPGGLKGLLLGLVKPHSHDSADSVDDALTASREGMRALAVSLGGLAATALVQLVILVASGSVALLADTIHNFADALTAVPLAVAFRLGRRPPTRRYTYGFARAEDLAGICVVVTVAISAVVAGFEAIDRLVHPSRPSHLAFVAAAGVVGALGNELVAQHRIRVGRRIGSAALEADGYHARTDGISSLGVLAGAIGLAAGWRDADAVFGLVITVSILAVVRRSARDIYRRLMDAVDPSLVDKAEAVLAGTPGVRQVQAVRMRWVGHSLYAEVDIAVAPDLDVTAAHDIADEAHHRLVHQVRRLSDATVHVNPDGDPHHRTAHHR